MSLHLRNFHEIKNRACHCVAIYEFSINMNFIVFKPLSFFGIPTFLSEAYKRYSAQPAPIELVGRFNLNINQEIKVLVSLTMPLVDLRIVKRRNPFLPVCIQEISPPLQHQFAFVDKLRLMDIRRPHRITLHMAHLSFYRIL